MADAVSRCLRRTESRPRRPRVTVSAAVGIAALWLVPRLAAFQELEPDVDVRLSADNRMVDLEREDIDLALRYVSPETPPPASSLLFDEVVFPVASPAVVAGLPAVLRAEDLARLTLLAFENAGSTPWLSWEPWLQGLGLAHAKPKAVLQFNQYDQMIRTAEDGGGIALGRGPLVAQAIAAGRLRPLPTNASASRHAPTFWCADRRVLVPRSSASPPGCLGGAGDGAHGT
jgi:DNA-binding transcriptional LysR family regulator